MTAIVGLAHGGAVYMGGDSAGVAGWAMTVRADTKVFRTGPYLMGFTSSYRMGQLLRYQLDVAPPAGDLDRFMATTFVDSVRRCLRDGGWMKAENEREQGGTFLVGVCGRLFRVESDNQVAESADGYDAVGCGAEVALGVLYATSAGRAAPSARVRTALEAAAHFSAGVRGPFVLLHQKAARRHA